ncbi:hypothetical protein E2F46_06160 [Luteimonas aestuarii]|uniref:Uncharacterized protein n=1 Tax=Luteimonas aestuarii TaxID=453837 RepID=A0A4R5TY91_9GAMM|nr:hypothetical protein [Luteimonas aestuarii]TDK26178.1 hypothetical protein E2F46_06160 [Luteimonas aestuarii]
MTEFTSDRPTIGSLLDTTLWLHDQHDVVRILYCPEHRVLGMDWGEGMQYTRTGFEGVLKALGAAKASRQLYFDQRAMDAWIDTVTSRLHGTEQYYPDQTPRNAK